MTKMEALKAMVEGKKVSQSVSHEHWKQTEYIEIKGNTIVGFNDDDWSRVFDSYPFSEDDDWELYVKRLSYDDFVVGYVFTYEHYSYEVFYKNEEVILAKALCVSVRYKCFYKDDFDLWKNSINK